MDGAQIDRFCDGAKRILDTCDRGKEGVDVLRRFAALLVASARSDQRLPRLPVAMLEQLYSILVEPQQGPPCLRLLCSMVLGTLMPSRLVAVDSFDAPVERKQIHLLVPVLLAQGGFFALLSQHLRKIVSWVVGHGDKDLRMAGLTAVNAVNRSYHELLERQHILELNKTFLDLLRHTSSGVTLPGQKQASLFELDGSKTDDYYTVLTIGKAYEQEQVLSMQVFSLMRGWLRQHYGTGRGELDEEPVAGPLDSLLKDAITEVCLRVCSQGTMGTAEEFQGERDHARACVVEGILILDELATIEPSLVPRLAPSLKQLFGRAEAGPLIQLALVQFFTHHGEAVVYDLEPALAALFGECLHSNYRNGTLGVELLEFCISHEPQLKSTAVFRQFFPNLLKVLAWSPRSYLGEFLELVPALIQDDIYVEVLHCILDFPCLSAALEMTSGVTHPGATSPLAQAFLNYILRDEGGLGGTISRLGDLHDMFAPYKSSARVQTAAQITPLLLRAYFQTFVSTATYEQAQQMIVLMFERVILLYSMDAFRIEVRKVLAEQILAIFAAHPQAIVDLKQDLLDFIGNRRNVGEGREEFFIHVVWIIGEYASSTSDARATAELLEQYYNALEEFLYEVLMYLQNREHAVDNTAYQAVHTTRLMTILMTAMAKLGIRCQDLILRVLLVLTKVRAQHAQSTQIDPTSRRAVSQRAFQLISALKEPNIAAAVLTPAPDAAQRLVHNDPTASLALLPLG